MKFLQWGLALGLGGFLIFFGVTKFTGAAHIFPYIEYRATDLGFPMAGLFFPLVNWATGTLEIIAGGLLFLPATRRWGALVAVLPFAGACAFHLSPLLGISTPDGFADPVAVDALAAGGPFVRGHFTDTMSTGLFTIAAVMLVLAIINVAVQRR